MAEKLFPILGDDQIKALPWYVFEPHEKQAQCNHSQSLARLAQRGGLGIEEAYCVLNDIEILSRMKFNKAAVRVVLMKFVYEAEKGRSNG